MASPVLDRSARGSHSPRSAVLGSVNWAFVITLLALLIFVFMWWTVTEERDKAKKDLEVKTTANTQLQREGLALVAELDATSKILGFPGDVPLRFGDQSAQTVNREKALQHLLPNGEIEVKDEAGNITKEPGMLKMLRELKLTMLDSTRSASGVPAEAAKQVEFTWMSQTFKSKLKAAAALLLAIPPAPVMPMDTSDEVRVADYHAKLAVYTKAYEAYFGNPKASPPVEGALAELKKIADPQEWEKFSEMIGGQPFDPDTSKQIEVLLGYKVTANELSSFQALMPLFKEPFLAILADYKINKETDIQNLAKARADLKAREQEIADAAKRYDELRTTSANELAAKATELESERAKAAKNEADARKAEQDLATMQNERKLERSKSGSELAALRARIAGDKEERDLEIRRDEVDGTLLAVDNATELGTINLGSNAKVYPGLKFAVSFVDRGGARQTIGEVQIIKVTGTHSSQVRILSAVQPLVGGHLLSNPLFSAGKSIHIYPVGWSPDVIQQRRLDEMGVIVDKAPTAGTDYFVVPDDWKGGVSAPKEGEDPAAAAAANPLDKARQEANTFGATVITRRMVESFLRL